MNALIQSPHSIRKVISLTLPALHPKQAEFVNDTHRVVVASCGTKTGKTFGLSIWLLRHAWNNYQSMNWWTAPTIRQARISFNYIGRWLPMGRYRVNRSDLAYYLLRSDGSVHSTIEFRSADNPDSLRGEGVHAAVVDEAGIWTRPSFISVQTTLTRTQGLLRIISTPKGRNWFYDEWQKGWSGNPKRDKDYASYTLPTSSNPTVPRASIEHARRNMPADAFRQEFEAEFLSESAGVFRNFDECSLSQLYNKPMAGHKYCIGIDWAKHNDYTVFIVGDQSTRDVVHIERWQDVDWNLNIDRAIRLARFWNGASVMMDATGIGDPIYDAMHAQYPNTAGYSISTNNAKKALVQKLQLAFEREQISIPDPSINTEPMKFLMATALLEELRMYSYRLTPTGIMQFSAPEGYHDDFVVALALLNWQFQEEPFIYRASLVKGL